jgi:hypothetical protein
MYYSLYDLQSTRTFFQEGEVLWSMICFCLVSIIHSFLLFNFRYLFLLDIFVFTSSFGTYMLLVQKKFPWIIWAFSLTLFLFVWLWNEHDVCSPDWQFWLRLVLLFGSLICWVIVDRFPSINHQLRLPLFRLALDSL